MAGRWRSFLSGASIAAMWVLADARLAWADWPAYGEPFTRGPGGYLSPVKLGLVWFLFLAWMLTAGAVNQDVQRHRLSYTLWNSVMVFPFLAVLALMWQVAFPLGFGISFTLLILAYVAPLGAYVYFRNTAVSAEKRILTPDHLRHWAAANLKRFGVKISAEKQESRALGPPVNYTAKGAKTDRENTAHTLLVKQSQGYGDSRALIADIMDNRADAAMLDFTQTEVAIRYQVDGVWHNSQPRERASGDLILQVYKTLANLNANERRGKQEGSFGLEFKGQKRTCRIVSQGVETGERVVLQLSENTAKTWEFTDLGMRDKIAEQLKEALQSPKGMVLFSSLPSGGLTVMMDTAMRSIDRFMRDVVTVEDLARREHDIQNVQVTTFNSAEGETALSVLPKLARAYPNVIIVRDLPDGKTVEFLLDQVAEDRLIVSGVRARESSEALLRILMLKAPPAKFAGGVTAVVNVRLIRKLCEACKEAYQPPPETLKALGVPAGKIEALYRPFQPPTDKKPPPPCPNCRGIGYLGRTGIYELLMVNDGVRQALVSSPKLEAVRLAARKAGMRTLQEEGIVLVVKGITSLAELQRVLKS